MKPRWAATAGLVLLLAGCPHQQPRAKVNEVASRLAPGLTLDADDPSTCEACHGVVVAEWRESLHRRASASSDPVYSALRTLRATKQGPQAVAGCGSCHTPRDPLADDSRAASGGVTCATCHQLDAVHLGEGRKGAAALVAAPAMHFRGPHDVPDGTSPVHASGPALAALTDGTTLCLACHAEERTAAGLPTCSTGPEHEASGDTRSCAECHMDQLDGPSGAVSSRASHRSHRFRGPHQTPALLAEAVHLGGRFDGDVFLARLENQTGHAFPTGFPGRLALLEVQGSDALGNQTSSTVSAEPMKDHPELVFNLGYSDAEGKPALAPFATKLTRDNRLRAAEAREIPVRVPAGTTKVALRLRFVLVAPGAAKDMGYTGPETQPFSTSPVFVTRDR